MLYKWNHTVCGLSSLSSSLKIHPGGSGDRQSAPFLCRQRPVRRTHHREFQHSPVEELGCSQLGAGTDAASVNTHAQVLEPVQVSLSLGPKPRSAAGSLVVVHLVGKGSFTFHQHPCVLWGEDLDVHAFLPRLSLWTGHRARQGVRHRAYCGNRASHGAVLLVS